MRTMSPSTFATQAVDPACSSNSHDNGSSNNNNGFNRPANRPRLDDAEHIILQILPQIASQLANTLSTERFQASFAESIKSAADFSKLTTTQAIITPQNSSDSSDNETSRNSISKIPTSTIGIEIPSNQMVAEVEDRVKPHLFNLLGFLSSIKAWILLLIPKIQDGNNFGVAVQENLLSDLRNFETTLLEYVDSIYSYYFLRAKTLEKVLKYPALLDYKQSVRKLDERQFHSLRYFAIQIKDICLYINDHFTKNMDKIKNPRTVDHLASLY